jgi:hypothetical protein
MADEYSVFGQLSQMNPSGAARNSKEVPVDKDSRRRGKGRKKERVHREEEDLEREEEAEASPDQPPVGKVVDITI